MKSFLRELPIWNDFYSIQNPLLMLEYEIRSTLEDAMKLRQNPPATNNAFEITSAPQVPAPQVPAPQVRLDLKALSKRLQKDEEVFAMNEPGRPWIRSKIKAIYLKSSLETSHQMTVVRLRAIELDRTFEVNKYLIARNQRHGSALRVPKRVVAGHNENELIPGILGQEPCDHNKNRYMVLFDNGSAGYFKPDDVYPICYQSTIPWRDFRHTTPNNKYLNQELAHLIRNYPTRRLLATAVGETINIATNGQNLQANIIAIDCDIAHIMYQDGRGESIFLGSARLCKRTDLISRLLVNHVDFERLNSKLLVSMKQYHRAGLEAFDELLVNTHENFKLTTTQTARKSTTRPSEKPVRVDIVFDNPPLPDDRDSLLRLQDYVRSRENKHKCSPSCLRIRGLKTEADVKDFIAEYRDLSDLKVPLLLGWRRVLVMSTFRSTKPKKAYVYESPCRRVFQTLHTIRKYIQLTGSRLDIDYFTLDTNVDLNRPSMEFKPIYYDANVARNKSGKPLENKDITLINQINEEKLPAEFVYCSKTFPHPALKKRGFSPNEDFKSACGCDDNCQSRISCTCQQFTEATADSKAYDTYRPKCHYKDKRLFEQVITGIFECNSFCGCDSRCPNRVVQNGIRHRLQICKMPLKGWGIITLDDIPAGAFVCTYAAELLDDADQYRDDDMYFSDLDYITVNEGLKQLDEDERSDEGLSVDGSESEAEADDKVKYKSLHTILNEKDDYTLDARVEGNVGRFLNHSCDPNTFVQNVFIETHDLRLPEIAFFARRTIKSGDEITWNYNYKAGSIPWREIYCRCGAPNCAGRIL